MAGTAADVIRIARAEVGYREGRSSSGRANNVQKYSPAVPSLEWSQAQAWCQTFQSWVFQQAGAKALAPVTASCFTACSWFKQRGRFSEYPAVGAQVFFGPGGGSHVGLVYAYDADYAYTIEGNTNATGSAEGDGVYLKKRARRDSYLYGYGYPAYPGGIVSADPNWRNPVPSPAPVPAPVPVPPAPRMVEVSVVEKELKSGWDPIQTQFNVVGDVESLSIGCDLGDIRVAVFVFTNTSDDYYLFADVKVLRKGNLAFWDHTKLPAGLRKISVKRWKRDDADDALAVPATVTLKYKPVAV